MYQLGPSAREEDIGIVEKTNNATHNITKGQYVIWKSNLYKASSNISSGSALSASNLVAVSNGIGADVAALDNCLGYSETETECGTWEGETLYKKIVGAYKTTEAWGFVVDTGIETLSKIKKYEVYCKNSDSTNTCSQYYVSATDMFRAAIQRANNKTSLYAQIGTSYPAHSGDGAYVWAVIYYTK